MSKHKPIPQELLDRLEYDETSPSCLRWRERGRGRRKDRAAGTLTPLGYYQVAFGPTGQRDFYRCHRLVWALHRGDPAELVVDHINEVRADNRLENLQAITAADNTLRRVGRGYYWCAQKRRWCAVVQQGGRKQHAGYFATEEEARSAYVGAKLIAAKGLTPQLEEFRHDS